MLDFDIAGLYEVGTKVLNQAVKRNVERFPIDFMFRLTSTEWYGIMTSDPMRSQIVNASQKKRNINVTPYAFTEHGITMLASVLRSEKAVEMNIIIVRAFTALRQFALNYHGLAVQILELQQITKDNNARFDDIYQALNLPLERNQEKEKWEERNRIGFVNS